MKSSAFFSYKRGQTNVCIPHFILKINEITVHLELTSFLFILYNLNVLKNEGVLPQKTVELNIRDQIPLSIV